MCILCSKNCGGEDMLVFRKELIPHSYLHITSWEKAQELPWVVFVHGGPGLNSGVLELLIEREGIFNSLDCNVILYDQQGCGRSKFGKNQTVKHKDNVSDLVSVINTVELSLNTRIKTIVGHSYGAKVLFDFIKESESEIRGVFLATVPSILIPRVNNLLLDLNYLKSVDQTRYQALLEEFDNFEDNSIWLLTEKLASVFHENKDKLNFYWANMKWKEIVTNYQTEINLPINTEVFMSVRKDLYSNSQNYSVDIASLGKYNNLWVNGFHDFVMNGQVSLSDPMLETTVFYKSAHYPHIEEHERFCEEVNNFICT
jgi:proline iminopeptidase